MVEKAVDIKTPIALEEATKTLTPERVGRSIHSCKNWGDLVKKLDDYIDIGANEIVLFSAPVKKEMQAVAKNVLSVF
jgi:hypothetical protein